MGNQNSMKSKSYGISDALSELMEAAVMADTNASKKSYEMIKQYAYGFSTSEEEQSSSGSFGSKLLLNNAIDSIGNNTAGMKGGTPTNTNTADEYGEEEDERSLAMAKFTMRSPDGNTQEVSIPQITMIPLPLLHVTEATFNLALSVNLVEKNETLDPEEQRCVDYIKDYYYRNTGRRAIPDIIDYLQNQVRMGYGSRTIAVSSSGSSPRYLTTQEQLKLLYKAQTVADGVIGSNSSFMVSQQDEGEAKATTNLTVDVKMAQAEIPDGIKLLLQSAANSLQVAAPTKDN
jgi:hypothetical protein